MRLETNEDLILICLEPPTSTEFHPVVRVLLFRASSTFEAMDVDKSENDMWTALTHGYKWKELTYRSEPLVGPPEMISLCPVWSNHLVGEWVADEQTGPLVTLLGWFRGTPQAQKFIAYIFKCIIISSTRFLAVFAFSVGRSAFDSCGKGFDSVCAKP